MKFNGEQDFEFFTSYATKWLNDNLPTEITFVLVTALPEKTIKIRSNGDGEDARQLLHLGFESVSNYLEAEGTSGVSAISNGVEQ